MLSGCVHLYILLYLPRFFTFPQCPIFFGCLTVLGSFVLVDIGTVALLRFTDRSMFAHCQHCKLLQKYRRCVCKPLYLETCFFVPTAPTQSCCSATIPLFLYVTWDSLFSASSSNPYVHKMYLNFKMWPHKVFCTSCAILSCAQTPLLFMSWLTRSTTLFSLHVCCFVLTLKW